MDMNRRTALSILGGMAAGAGSWWRALAAPTQADVAEPAVRLGILQFGSVAWQLDVIRRHDLARAERVRVEVVELASSQATLVALQAGRVDVIVSDLLWVARQRAGGADWSFVPYSSALGAVEVLAPSPLRSLGVRGCLSVAAFGGNGPSGVSCASIRGRARAPAHG